MSFGFTRQLNFGRLFLFEVRLEHGLEHGRPYAQNGPIAVQLAIVDYDDHVAHHSRLREIHQLHSDCSLVLYVLCGWLLASD